MRRSFLLILWIAMGLVPAAIRADRVPAGPGTVLLALPSLDLSSGASLVEAARAAGYRPVVWEFLKKGPLNGDVLADYRTVPVVRIIPSHKAEYAIGRDEAEALFWHMMHKGPLVLAGNDFARSSKDCSILLDVGVRFVSDDAGCLAIKGAKGDPGVASMTFDLFEKTPEIGPVRPDVIEALDGCALPFLEFLNEEGRRVPAGYKLDT